MHELEDESLHDDDIEITDLESDHPDGQAHSQGLFRGINFSPHIRTRLSIALVLSSILLVFVLIQYLLPLLTQHTPTKPQAGTTAQPVTVMDIAAADGIACTVLSNGTLSAIEAQSGHLRWQRHIQAETITLQIAHSVLYVNGIATHDNFIEAVRLEDGKTLWHDTLSAPTFFPAQIQDGRIYLTLQDGKVLALQESNGQELWSVLLISSTNQPPTLFVDTDTVSIVSADSLDIVHSDTGKTIWYHPLMPEQLFLGIHAGKAFITTQMDTLTVFDLHTGQIAWSYSSPERASWSPVLDGDTVYVNNTTTQGGSIEALRASDGKPLWQAQPDLVVAEVPVIQDDMAYVKTVDGFVLALDARSGKQLWRYQLPVDVVNWSPVKIENILYLQGLTSAGTMNGSIYAIDSQTGKLLWQYQTGMMLSSLPWPASEQGHLYIQSGDDTVDALQLDTGKVLWRSYIHGGGVSGVSVKQGVVYVTLVTGGLIALEGDTGKELWHYPEQ